MENFIGWHGDAVVSAVASQKKRFLLQSNDMWIRSTGYSEFPIVIKVNMPRCLSLCVREITVIDYR